VTVLERVGAHAGRHRGVLIATAVFLGTWGLTHFLFYPKHFLGDVPLYRQYGDAVRHGHVPYRDFEVDYPPGALPMFVLPALPGAAYVTLFEWLTAAVGVGCIALVAACRPPRLALAFLAVSPLFVGALYRTHFDLWPTALLVAALAALLRERHRLGWGLLALSAAAKLFAVVLLPVGAVWTLRRAGRGALAAAAAVWIAVVAVCFVPFLVLAPHGLWSSVSGQLSRPLQIETLAGSYLMTFAQPVIQSWHGSKSLPHEDSVAALTTGLLLSALLALWVGFARGPTESERLKRYAAACVCAFLCFGKVLSPQFLIWLVPLVLLARGRRAVAAAVLLAGAAANTQVWFPNRYYPDYAWAPQLSLAWLVLVRNLMLVAALAALVLPERVPQLFGSREARRRAASTTASAR
jgi:glycosyl transferase family 87